MSARVSTVLSSLAAVEMVDRGIAVMPASRLQRPSPPTVGTGIAALDELTGGFPRGALTEICGPPSSGRTSVLLAVLAEMTRRQEVCAVVDASDSFDPASASAAGVDLRRLLWVRCSAKQVLHTTTNADAQRRRASSSSPLRRCDSALGFAVDSRRSSLDRVEQALKATDLLLQGGGFGLVVVDFADILPVAARRVPLASWFRFRRAVENTPTVLLVLEQEPFAKTCASLVLNLSAAAHRQSPATAQADVSDNTHSAHASLLRGLEIHAELLRDRQQQKKPVRPAATRWDSQVAWAG